jgi:hypothetical protein
MVPVRNQVRMIPSLASMSGLYRPKNSMACGKGLIGHCFYITSLTFFFGSVDDINSICSLIYEVGLKQRLLRYAASALLFTERGVDPCLVSWNRLACNTYLETARVLLQIKRIKACIFLVMQLIFVHSVFHMFCTTIVGLYFCMVHLVPERPPCVKHWLRSFLYVSSPGLC